MFGQAMAFHLSLWYSKADLARRVGIFISAGSVAGAFGGLIAFGVQHIKSSAIKQWRILFLIEGCPSVVLAIAVALFMPTRPEKSKLLTGAQRELCLARLNAENNVDNRRGIDWAGVRRSLTDWKTYVVSVGYSCLNLGLGSVGGFLPTIIKGLGYSNAKVSQARQELADMIGSIVHCSSIRRRSCYHVAPHIVLRLEADPWNPCSRYLPSRSHRVGDPSQCTCPRTHRNRSSREVLWLYLRCRRRLRQYPHHHL
jgi:hypothetical protein